MGNPDVVVRSPTLGSNQRQAALLPDAFFFASVCGRAAPMNIRSYSGFGKGGRGLFGRGRVEGVVAIKLGL